MIPELVKSTDCAGMEKRNQIYGIEVIEVLRKQFAFAKGDNVTLLLLRQKLCDGQIPTPGSYRHLMTTICAFPKHDFVQSKIIRLPDKNVCWRKDSDGECNSFVGMFQLYKDETFLILKADAIVAYPVQCGFLNFKKQFKDVLFITDILLLT